jgi:hypothetical protein
MKADQGIAIARQVEVAWKLEHVAEPLDVTIARAPAAAIKAVQP